MASFDESLHPRGAGGRFRPKLSQSVRVSPISISYNAGIRIPVIPGRANVYVGALFRLERARGGTFLKKQTDAAVDRIFGSKKDGVFATLLKDREVKLGNGMTLRGPDRVLNTPSLRLTRVSGGSGRPGASRSAPERHYAPGGKTYRAVPQRAGRRAPRAALVNGRRVR